MTNAVEKIENKNADIIPDDPMVAMIERVVLDPNADLDKLERMLTMKERIDADRRAREFSAALSACQSAIPTVIKNKENRHTSSSYADLAAIYQAAKPIVAAHGFSFSTFPAQCERPNYQGIRWVLRHEGGHVEEDIAEVPVDDKGAKGTTNKTATHAFGSTASYGRRYLFCMIFDIATGDDTDGNAPETSQSLSEEQYRELQDLVERSGADEGKFLLAYGAKTLAEFPAKNFNAAVSQLKKKMARAK